MTPGQTVLAIAGMLVIEAGLLVGVYYVFREPRTGTPASDMPADLRSIAEELDATTVDGQTIFHPSYGETLREAAKMLESR